MIRQAHRGGQQTSSGKQFGGCPGASRPESAFTLIELLVVIAIVTLMIGLATMAISSLNNSGNITAATYQVKGILEEARSYATANDTYVWVGFFEENGSKPSASPATPGIGRLVISVVASSDGTMIYDSSSNAAAAALNPTRLIQIGKLVKINSMHLMTAAPGGGTGNTFDTRPSVNSSEAQIGDTSPSAPSLTPFQYPLRATGAPRYTFTKAIQFNPRGEAQVNNSTYAIQPVVEVGLQAAHGAMVDTANKNVAAVQVTGIAGNVNIYRR